MKAIWNGKEIAVPATVNPFGSQEAHLTDAVYYRELPEYEQLEQLKNQPRVIRLPDWEEVERGTVNRKKHRRAQEGRAIFLLLI